MNTVRNEVSYKSPYYISKDRYLELKHFCLQYSDYKHRIALEREKTAQNRVFTSNRTSGRLSDKTAKKAVNLAILEHYTGIIEDCCKKAGGDIESWLFTSVTTGKSYYILNPPCSKQYFYLRYRTFFYLLDKVR